MRYEFQNRWPLLVAALLKSAKSTMMTHAALNWTDEMGMRSLYKRNDGPSTPPVFFLALIDAIDSRFVDERMALSSGRRTDHVVLIDGRVLYDLYRPVGPSNFDRVHSGVRA